MNDKDSRLIWESITEEFEFGGHSGEQRRDSVERQAYVVSDSEITIRKIVRVLFFSGVLLLAGTIIYLKVKKK